MPFRHHDQWKGSFDKYKNCVFLIILTKLLFPVQNTVILFSLIWFIKQTNKTLDWSCLEKYIWVSRICRCATLAYTSVSTKFAWRGPYTGSSLSPSSSSSCPDSDCFTFMFLSCQNNSLITSSLCFLFRICGPTPTPFSISESIWISRKVLFLFSV